MSSNLKLTPPMLATYRSRYVSTPEGYAYRASEKIFVSRSICMSMVLVEIVVFGGLVVR
ncbi:MAG: hypothetical protein HC785_22700 [Calothrix sp. CSU_2_0]|nr:hypothetical protein [Calothrix sp. CSU_2_0]